jgi:2-polyprenyl-3-methyl-5-hydroxy-6-metoxy-1,4-benzoquinol methylase
MENLKKEEILAQVQVNNADLLKIFFQLFKVNNDFLIKNTNSINFEKSNDSTTLISFVKNNISDGMLLDGHLGGCMLECDPATWTPLLWDSLIHHFSVESVVDVGCGVGFSTEYFSKKVSKVLGIEGSEEAIKLSKIKNLILKHDYEKSNLKLESKYDLVWCCEFVEHVEEKYMQNFIDTFKSAKIVAMTYATPGQGGHHHVNEQHEDYWLRIMQNNKFEFLRDETEKFRKLAFKDGELHNSKYNDNHFAHRGLIFLNTEF